MRLNRIVVFFFAVIVPYASAYSIEVESEIKLKLAPEVTEERIQAIFMNNLKTKEPTLSGLLLAIAIDHTSKGSPHIHEEVGIPYIVSKTPLYWGGRLKDGDEDIDVLVNNALLLLFTDHDIPDSVNIAYILLHKAADKGYWPADFYIAERNLVSYFIDVGTEQNQLLPEELMVIGNNTMDRYNNCASMGFPLCKFRIGFWLSGSDDSLADGIKVLRDAIDTTLKDRRYKEELDTAVVMAATLIIDKGEQVGVDEVMRSEYRKLLGAKLSEAEERINEALVK